jgi:site-specific recombinase XerD
MRLLDSQSTLPAPSTLPARPDEHPVLVYLNRLSPGSRRAMGQALRAVVAVYTGREVDAATEDEVLAFPWAQMGFQHVQKVRAALADRYSPASANKILSALRGVLHAAFRLGQMSAEEYQRASDVEAVKGTAAPRGRALKSGEITALFEACDPATAQGARDAALLAVLYAAGLRRSEAVALDLADYDQESGVLTVRSGKGRKARTGHATNGAKAALDAWLVKRGGDAGPFFLPIHRSGAIHGRRMTDQSVLAILDRIRRKAKVRPFSPHDLRRSFISDLLDRGADIATVQRMAGHANITTTARYDRRGEEAKRKAAELLHVPFAG